MMTEQGSKVPALFVGQPEQTTALARFRTSKELSIHAKRIMKMDPGQGNNKLRFDEALMVAGASLGNNLDYTMGELHWWIQGAGDYRRLIIMRGRDGTERQAHESAKREGTRLEPERYSMLDKNTKTALAIPIEDLAIEAIIEDRASYQAWLDRQKQLKEIGYTREEIRAEVGDAPATRGIGIVSKVEMDSRDNPRWIHKCESSNWKKITLRGFDNCPDCDRPSRAKPIKFSNVELARKRALTAALRHWAARIDPSEMAAGASTNLDDYAIDGEWREVSVEEMTGEQLDEAANGADALYGDGAGDNLRQRATTTRTENTTIEKGDNRKAPNYWPAAILDAIVEANHADNHFEAAGMLSYSAFDRNVAKTPALTYAKAYRGARDEDKPPKEAGEIGTAAYMNGLRKRRERSKNK